MNKMRENTAIILWILVISFGGLWVLQDSGAFDNIGFRAQTNIAEVNGDAITYEQFSRTLDAYVQQYQNQTGEQIPPQMRDQYAEMVFNSLVDNVLLEQEVKRLGITVSDEEVYEMVLGDEPDPLIREQFGDGQGGIDRQLIMSVIDNAQFREEWIALEEYLRAKRRQEKLENLLASTVRISDQDVREEYLRRNTRFDAEYIALRYADIPDDSVSITDRDLRNYYNQNRDEFHVPRTYVVEYARLEKRASEEDSAAVMQELERLRPRFETAENDSAFLVQYGAERGFSHAYFRADELGEDVASAIFDGEITTGRVIGPVAADGEGRLIKIRDVRPTDEVAVRARHILFGVDPDDEEREFARDQAQQVKARLDAGEDFATLARQYSDDPGSAQRGGDLGWFGPGVMVRPFEEAAFGAAVGSIIGPIESTFGFHLIKVQNRADREVQIAQLSMSLQPAEAGVARLIERAEDIRYYGRNNFAAEARNAGFDVREAQVQEGQQFIPDLGMSRAVIGFLERSSRGTISEPIELDDAIVLVHLKDVRREGYRSFEEVRGEIEPRVLLEQKRLKQAERLRRAAQAGDLDAIADRVDATTRTATGVTVTNPFIAGLGREPRFVGTALGLREGRISPVVEGESHAFVLRVTNLVEPDVTAISASEKERLRNEMLENRRQVVVNRWITALRESADIRDFRYRFHQ